MNTNTIQSLEALLVQTLTELKAGAEKTTAFAIEQAPDVIQQLLVYKFWSSVIAAAGCLALAAWLFKWARKELKDCGADAIAPGLAIIAALLIGAVSIYHCNVAVKIKLAPKVYLIEYATIMIRGK